MTEAEANCAVANFVAGLFGFGLFLVGLTMCISVSIDAYKFYAKVRKRDRIKKRKVRQLQRAFEDRRPKPRMPWQAHG